MKPISQSTYNEMKKLGLLEPEVIKDCNGKSIYIKDKDTGRMKKVVNKKFQIANRNKKSKVKSYFVEEPVYQEFQKLQK